MVPGTIQDRLAKLINSRQQVNRHDDEKIAFVVLTGFAVHLIMCTLYLFACVSFILGPSFRYQTFHQFTAHFEADFLVFRA